MDGESEKREAFEGWCIVELMGHRKLGGHVREQEIAGRGFIRLDVPDGDQSITQLYSPQAVYCISPVTEQLARAYASKCKPEPISPFELRQCAPELFDRPRAPALAAAEDEEEEEDADDGGDAEAADRLRAGDGLDW
jgi:hypothetical protein